MNHKPLTILLVTVALISASTVALAADATVLIDQIKQRMERITSYTAELKIKVDVSFMKVPESKATLSHVAPDKTTINAPGFAMLPKQGADLGPLMLLSKPHASVDAGTEEFQGVRMRKVKIIPADETTEIVVATVLIDTTLMVPRKIITTTRAGGTATAELVYDNAEARSVVLPSYIKLIFDIGAFELPKTMTGDFEKKKGTGNGEQGTGNGEQGTKKDGGRKTTEKAVVEIWYTKYQIKKK